MEVPAAANVEGRPAREETSPLQALIDSAAPGSTVEIGPGEYRGAIVIDKPLHLLGRARPRLVRIGEGSVVRVRAEGVTVEGIDVDGLDGGDLGRDASGVHVAARRAVIRDVRVRGTVFGIYLRSADGARVEDCFVRGIPGRDAGEKGSGIHVYDTDGFTLERNEVVDARDGLYVQSSPHGVVRGNSVREVRYGLHYMYSDDNLFEDNVFEQAGAGAVLMYSRRIVFRRNRLLHNRGFASVGLLLQAMEDCLAEDNLIADNARGMFLEGSRRNLFRRNLIAESDSALVLYDSCAENRFTGNSFVGNLTPLTLVGRRTDTVFEGNYWSENDEPDLDGDGRSDRPYVLSNLFDHLRGNLTAADLLAQSTAASALAIAERSFPVLAPLPVADSSPLSHPPPLPAVPRPRPGERTASWRGLAGSLAALAAGLLLLVGGRRRA
jgi:nitrous oxidase accessory protein